jgi:hypothetical protein
MTFMGTTFNLLKCFDIKKYYRYQLSFVGCETPTMKV